jgi:hypothetical protein
VTKVLVYDIECGALEANRGRMYAFAWKWLDITTVRGKKCRVCSKAHSKVSVPSVLDYNEVGDNGLMRLYDRDLVKHVHELMKQSDVALTFNGQNFDRPNLNAKFIREGLPPLPYTRMIDLYQVARHTIRVSPKSLANLAHYFRLKHQKTKLDWDVWDAAREGDAKSIKYIRDHGAADVLVTEELYLDHLRPWIPNHPFLFDDREPCNRCGGKMLRDKKMTTNAGKPKVQYVCKSCGGYQTRAA